VLQAGSYAASWRLKHAGPRGAGVEAWQGRSDADSFSSRCRLLQQLFAAAGGAVLGRGMAALPRAAVAGATSAAVVAHMAADATRAAAESPFLEGQLPGADSLLCCIGMPPMADLGAGWFELWHPNRVAPFSILALRRQPAALHQHDAHGGPRRECGLASAAVVMVHLSAWILGVLAGLPQGL